MTLFVFTSSAGITLFIIYKIIEEIIKDIPDAFQNAFDLASKDLHQKDKL